MKIHSLLHGSRANGPNLRSVVWVQGCGMVPKCPGCVNPDTWDFGGGTEVDPDVLARKIVQDAPLRTDGLSVSGGEPLQCDELLDFIERVKFLEPDWTVGLFTGYRRSELCTIPAWTKIRATLDFAVLGRYDRAKPCPLPLTSSWNQELVLLSSRYTLNDFPAQSEEVFVGPDGLCQITGFAR